jgi:hypothetical protein
MVAWRGMCVVYSYLDHYQQSQQSALSSHRRLTETEVYDDAFI